jgi:hypothetical protein
MGIAEEPRQLWYLSITRRWEGRYEVTVRDLGGIAYFEEVAPAWEAVDAGVVQGFRRGGERHRDCPRHVPDVLRIHVRREIQVLDLSRDCGGQSLRIEERDPPDAALSLGQPPRERLAAVPVGGEATDSGDRDATLGYARILATGVRDHRPSRNSLGYEPSR